MAEHAPSAAVAEISMGNNPRATTSEVVNLANWNGQESTSGKPRVTSDSIMTLCLEMVGLLIPVLAR